MKKRIMIGLLFFVIAEVAVWSIYWAGGGTFERNADLEWAMFTAWLFGISAAVVGFVLLGEILPNTQSKEREQPEN